MDAATKACVPPKLDLLCRFVNTLDYDDPPGRDELQTVASAGAWCRERGLSAPADASESERLRGFREALRGVLYANNGEEDPMHAWEAMRPYIGSTQYVLASQPEGDLRLAACGAGTDRAIGAMLAIVYEAMAGGTWMRLRACRKSSCRYAYFDSTKNGSRAWCSMSVCGNREKAARRRSRDRQPSE